MTETLPTKKRIRSPNYPIVDLEAAIERAEALFAKYDRHAVPVAMAQAQWNYRAGSSIAEQIVAALKAFGLLDVSGLGKAKKVSVSEAAERIIRNAPDRAQLIRDAAVKPKIHAEIWAKYQGKKLPPDDVIQTYLLWDREEGKFKKEVVDDVISRFRSSIYFAKFDQIGLSDTVGDEEQHPHGTLGTEGDYVLSDRPDRRTQTTILPLPVPMEDGTIQIVNIPRMTSSVYAFFIRQLDAYKSAIIIDASSDDVADEAET